VAFLAILTLRAFMPRRLTRTGVAFVSDRLDIVRLIDARVTSTRRTVTRSKRLAEAARDDLHIHEDWLRQHRERSEVDLRRHQRRMKHRQRFQTFKSFMVSVVLFVPRLCVALYRGVVAGLRKIDDVFLSGCAWLGRTAYAAGRSLIGILSGSGGWIGSKALTLGLVLAAALSLTLSSLGKGAYAIALALIDATARGLSWLGPRAASFGQGLSASLSLNLSRLAASMGEFRRQRGSGAKRQEPHLSQRLRPRAAVSHRKPTPAPDPSRLQQTAPVRLRAEHERRQARIKPAPALDPSRPQQAAFVHLRAEHERLQARIHAMDRRYEQRSSDHRREWVELRRLSLNARRMFEVQEQQMLGPAAWGGNGALPPPQVAPAPLPAPSVHPLWAGHAIYQAPALATGTRVGRARPRA
jgi:hypothetical protein